jgi:phospholipid transport system substrate-binding protein
MKTIQSLLTPRSGAKRARVFNTTAVSFTLCLLLSLGIVPSSLADGDALETLKAKIDEGVQILDDPELAGGDGRDVKEDKLWRLSEELFDYPVMSRLVLGSYWNELTPQQKEAFYVAFTAFLRRAYVPRLLERYSGQRLGYGRQQTLSPSKAVVEAYVFWKGRKIPFNVHMIKRQTGWKIYDISIIGVSSIKNYRAQFRWLLLSGTLDQLIARLNERSQPAS